LQVYYVAIQSLQILLKTNIKFNVLWNVYYAIIVLLKGILLNIFKLRMQYLMTTLHIQNWPEYILYDQQHTHNYVFKYIGLSETQFTHTLLSI